MTEKIKSEVISRRRVFSLLGLAIASGLVATIPVSPQVTPRGVVSINGARWARPRSLACADEVIE